MKHKKVKTPQYSIELAIGPTVEHLPIVIRKHPTSRRMVIRYQPLQHHISLTLPRYVSIRQGLHFIEERRGWLERQIRQNVKQIPFSDGQVLSLMGQDYTLAHVGGRGVITVEENRILVPGDATFMKRRVTEWLRQQAKTEITLLVQDKAQQVGKTVKKIALRDTSSRWGSCSHDGNLSFSWRLIFAPRPVLEYVVSHEVAHLKHHNHGPAFWQLVEQLYPDYVNSQNWLKIHGAKLYSYGA